MEILRGNSLHELCTFPDNYFDACVTDPPYGLAFMGKKWDYDVPSAELWREVFRVMKPGAHLLSFGGTRTYHRMVVAIEDAGFEIRDQIMWIYGSGFPKSLDVSKAIDKAAGAEREVVGRTGRAYADNPASGANSDGANPDSSDFGISGVHAITAPATPDAKAWQGWGTALKPANEPIVLARKPLEKGLTVAQNVLKWGTGALNVDAGRIPGPAWATKAHVSDSLMVDKNKDLTTKSDAMFRNKPDQQSHAAGRWPANVLLDEEAAAMLDEQSGMSITRPSRRRKGANGSWKNSSAGENFSELNDSGGASRFFYVAKASKRERNAGLEGMPEKSCTAKQQNSKGRMENGLVTNERPSEPRAQNHHPTVKPIKLMQYLIKLVTPPGGVVLDPFMGSGSTGVASKSLKLDFVGIELDKEYFEIAKKRIGL